MLNLEICKLDDKGKETCTRVKITRGMIAGVLTMMGVAAAINFFIGLAIGGPYLGLIYVGLSLILSLIDLACLVPVLGLIITIGLYGGWVMDLLSLFGIPTNMWTDAIFIVTWWIGLLVQIAVLIFLIYKIIQHVTHKGSEK